MRRSRRRTRSPASDKLARQVRASGIRKVSGNVIVDDRLWQTLQLENRPVTPIDINQNLIDYVMRPGKAGQIASITRRPTVAPWTVKSEVKTVAAGKATQIKVTSPAHGNVLLTGTIAAHSKPVVNTYGFDDPATFARTAFIEAVQRARVTVSANPTATNQVQLESIMTKAPDAAAWRAALPIMGVDGCLFQVERNSPAKGKVFAKTGTLAGGDLFNGRLVLPTTAIGGYIDARSGRRFAFAIMVTNSLFSDIEGVFAANDDVGKVAAAIQQAY